MEIPKTDTLKIISYLDDAARLYDALPMQSLKCRAHMIRQLDRKTQNPTDKAMIYPDHRLIAMRAVDYADSMCETSGGDNAVFDRHDIAVAYIQGGERTLRRVCLAIADIAHIGGLTTQQAEKLILTIEAIENNCHDLYDQTTFTTDTGADT